MFRLLDRTLGPYGAAWHATWQTLPVRHPMLHATFVDLLLRHWGNGFEYLCILGPLDAPQAMAVVRRVRAGNWQLFMPSQSQVGVALLRQIDDVAHLLPALPGRPIALDLMAIDPAVVPTDFAVDRPLEIMPYAYTMTVHLQGSFEDYWQRRSKKLRENMRRNLLEAQDRVGALDYRWIEDPAEMAAAVTRYAELESRGWKQQDGTALAPGNAQHWFYTQVMQEHGAVAEMWAQGQLMASRLIWAPPGAPVAALKTTYTEDHKSAGLGRVLLRWFIERAHHRWPGQRLEFCTDARGDLVAWSDEQRHVSHLTLYSNEWVRGIRNASQAIARTVSPPSAPPVRTGSANGLGLSVHRSVRHLPAPALGLLERAEHRSLQLGQQWLATLEDTVYRGREAPYYFVLTQGSEALVVWPLLGPARIDDQGLHSMSNYYCALTGPAVQPWCKPIQMVSLIQFMVSTLSPAYRLQLYPLDPNDHATHLTRAALRMAGFGVFGYFGFGNWVHEGLNEGEQRWKAYLLDRSGSLRSNIKRAQKKLTEAGGHVEIITNPSDLMRGIRAYESVYARSWKKPEPCPDFFRELAQRLSERNQLRMGIAWLGEKPIAAAYWTVAHGVAEIHKLAYDEEHKPLSAGTALSGAMFEQALEKDGVKKIDYLIGDDEYKQFWMNRRQQRWGFIGGRVHHPMGALLVLTEGIRRVVKRSLVWSDLQARAVGISQEGRRTFLRRFFIAAAVVMVLVIFDHFDR